MSFALTISGLSKTYPNGVRALCDVSLSIPTGMFGLLGPNGAGKSTLMRTLATLQDADSGTVHIRAAGPPQGANSAPSGGSAAAKPQAWGDHIRAAGPPQGANSAPSGGSAAREPEEPPQGRTPECEARGSLNPPQAWGDVQSIDVLRDKAAVRRMLGYLPQDFGVYPKVSAEELLDHLARLKGLSDRKLRRDVVTTLLRQTNLYDVRKKVLGGFSGGMRQRFGIAQALLGNPRLIIVDEPTAGLDPEERVRFHNLLAEIGENVIVILSTHIVSDVSDLCAQMAIIDKGRVLLTGRPFELTRRLDGRVWQKAIARADLAATKALYPVISTRLVAGRTLVNVVSDGAPGEGFAPVDATLDDVYFAAIAGRLDSSPALQAA